MVSIFGADIKLKSYNELDKRTTEGALREETVHYSHRPTPKPCLPSRSSFGL